MKTIAGMVGSNGSRTFGAGFSTSRVGTGVYSITFPVGTWPSTPMLVATPFNTAGGAFTATVTGLSLGAGGAAGFTVTIYDAAGTPADTGFTFVAAAT